MWCAKHVVATKDCGVKENPKNENFKLPTSGNGPAGGFGKKVSRRRGMARPLLVLGSWSLKFGV
jgi:hypothetical protein